jgi:exopolysaccharide biosynthesis polyprenyl glycosylphosphotransferase
MGASEGAPRCLRFIFAGLWVTSLALLPRFFGPEWWLQSFQTFATPFALFLVLSVMLSAAWHWLVGAMALTVKEGILFIGDDPLIKKVIEATKQRFPQTFEIVGPWPGHKPFESSVDFFEKIQQLRIRHIIYSNQAEILPHIAGSLLEARFKRLSLYDAVSYYQNLTGALPVYHLDDQALLALSQKEFVSPRLAASIKRAMDIFFTLLLLPLALPVLGICALAIKLDSSGPIFFVQERLGLNGNPFNLWKLRTMVVNAEGDAPQWCQDNDPRITRVGKILRKLRLDELPQLLNVLRSDMSLVGPRPIRRHFTDLLAQEVPFYRLRLSAKPGLTGWAQVQGGHANTVATHARMLQYDLFYLIHQSVWLDLLILLKTIRIILLGKGR